MVCCIGEIFGTFLLTLVICTVLAAAVITGMYYCSPVYIVSIDWELSSEVDEN